MKYLRRFNESVDNIKSNIDEIKQTIKDILLPISDMGYEISVINDMDYNELTGIIIRVVSYVDPILKMDDEVKDEFIRMKEYLESLSVKSIEALYVRTGTTYTDSGTYTTPRNRQMNVDFSEFISMEDCELQNLLFIAKI